MDPFPLTESFAMLVHTFVTFQSYERVTIPSGIDNVAKVLVKSFDRCYR